MPLAAAAADVMPAGVNGTSFGGAATTRVVLCDQLYRASIGADCGGPAEDAWLVDPASRLLLAGSTTPALVDRFEAAPGRWISVYRP